MKRDDVKRQRKYGSLLMAMLLVPLAVPAWAQDKVPTLSSPAGAAGQAAGEISAQVNGPLTCNLWNQPQSIVNTNAYASQDFTDFDVYDIFLADDFTNKVAWQIDTFFVPGGLWNGATTLANADNLVFAIYRDNGGKPDGDPKGGGEPPVWSLAVPPADSRITIETDLFGTQGNVTLALESPVSLQPGTYWLIFYPQMEFTSYGQYGRNVADTANLANAQVINPGGGFGYVPTSWGDASVLGMSQHDLAFCLQGKEGFPWPMFLPEITKEK